MYVERTFTVTKPIEVVFDHLSDFTNTTEWDPGTVATTRISGEGGPGTRYANTSQFMGRRVELTYETITHQRPERLQFRGRNKSAIATDTLGFTAEGPETTRINYRADFEFGVLVGLVAPFVVKPKLGALADETVEQMQRCLNAL
ncbi:SRPBCC family protein [Nocardioides sp.]|uniref:SRPBCC family protein n=1 Tax=Nocardioides sp. TaxID=35761 RepID=UPI003569EC9F